jgi:N-acetyl sugar amidotransferase
MDVSDSQITFDKHGVCDHCRDFRTKVEPNWKAEVGGGIAIEKMSSRIKARSNGQEYNCILGLSGGIDSSYMLHYAVKEMGLKPLVFHVDAGWNSELAVNNIEVLVDKLKLDLFTEVIDWDDMREFQLACLRSGSPYLDIPQDHSFIATLYKYADAHGIRSILNGGNISTECVRNPLEFFYYGTDMFFIRDLLNRFADRPLKHYYFSSIFKHKIFLRYFRGLEVYRPLNCINYNKTEAQQLLEHIYNWKAYQQKHFESRFTKFFEGFWLPTRFGFDTRRVQYSSLILTGQMERNCALELLKKPAIDPELAKQECNYVAKKLGITTAELMSFIDLPKLFYWDFRNQEVIFNFGAKILKAIGVEKSIKR